MRRRGIKRVSLILTIISVIILILACYWTISMYRNMAEMERPENELNFGGIIYLFGVLALLGMISINGTINVVLIILNSIDLKKTKREGNTIKYSLTFLLINIGLLVGDFLYFFLLNPELYGR